MRWSCASRGAEGTERLDWLQYKGHPICYSDRLCSDRHYSNSPQLGRRVADCSWINLLYGQYQLERCETKSQEIVLEVHCRNFSKKIAEYKKSPWHHSVINRQRLWLRLGVNVDDQLWLRLNPIPICNCNPSASPSPCRNTNTNPNPNPNPNRPTTPLLTLTDPLTSK